MAVSITIREIILIIAILVFIYIMTIVFEYMTPQWSFLDLFEVFKIIGS